MDTMLGNTYNRTRLMEYRKRHRDARHANQLSHSVALFIETP